MSQNGGKSNQKVSQQGEKQLKKKKEQVRQKGGKRGGQNWQKKKLHQRRPQILVWAYSTV